MGTELPWERDSGAQGTGICLSGGGVRAAAFAFGALQQLQEDLHLLRGDSCADLLVGVSGGSYVAAASTLGARQQAGETCEGPPPLASNTPESAHIREYGRFLLSRLPFPQRRMREASRSLVGVGLRFVVNL